MKLTQKDVDEIRASKGKIKNRILAKRYCIHISAIQKILRNERWAT
jgi:hypothetical protein